MAGITEASTARGPSAARTRSPAAANAGGGHGGRGATSRCSSASVQGTMRPDHEPTIETVAVHGDQRRPRPEGSLVYPIYQGTVYAVEPGTDYHDLRYHRLSTTPSQLDLHARLAALEGGEAAVATASGNGGDHHHAAQPAARRRSPAGQRLPVRRHARLPDRARRRPRVELHASSTPNARRPGRRRSRRARGCSCWRRSRTR